MTVCRNCNLELTNDEIEIGKQACVHCLSGETWILIRPLPAWPEGQKLVPVYFKDAILCLAFSKKGASRFTQAQAVGIAQAIAKKASDLGVQALQWFPAEWHQVEDGQEVFKTAGR